MYSLHASVAGDRGVLATKSRGVYFVTKINKYNLRRPRALRMASWLTRMREPDLNLGTAAGDELGFGDGGISQVQEEQPTMYFSNFL